MTAKFTIRGPQSTKSETITLKQGSDLMMIEDEHGNQLGINFKSDGTFEIGGWDTDGMWQTLSLVKECDNPACRIGTKHGRDFALDQYTHALLDTDL